jgi:hypothetical protein
MMRAFHEIGLEFKGQLACNPGTAARLKLEIQAQERARMVAGNSADFKEKVEGESRVRREVSGVGY